MPDWTKGMQQTFEYYEVDPNTWLDKRKLITVTSCSINRDEDNETLGSATIDATEEFGEIYVRVYLVTIQNRIEEKFCLGTFLIQTPHNKYNGKTYYISHDAYTPLLEYKDPLVPLGYSFPKGANIMSTVYSACFDVGRIPVVAGSSDITFADDFVADPNDSWLSFLSDAIANAKFSFGLDDTSRVVFVPNTDIASLQPRWTYNDDNSSILYPDISKERDLYGIPNVVEILYTDGNNGPVYKRIVNDDPDSQTSVVNRGREIIHRDTSPAFNGAPMDKEIEEYATNVLRNLSTLEYKVTYKHGYCPVRVGDCVRLNYEKAGLVDVKAKVISQSITCRPGCPVEETAIYTIKMWEG